jgi:opacity protein-like surface antigen
MTITRQFIASAALALGTLAAGSNATLAGGEVVYGSGVRQAGAAVPVPAPAPVPEVATGWYVRVDAAYSQGDVSKYKSTSPNADLTRSDSYVDNFPRYGLGFGYHLNKWLRADITFDQRNDAVSRGSGSVNYTLPNPTGGTSTVTQMRDTFSDGFTTSNSTGLLNVYADLPVHRAFTPYIGGGLGFVRHQLKGRSFSRVTECVDANDCDTATAGDQGGAGVVSTATTTAGGVQYQFAAALMAGFTYQVWENTKIDLGYRWLHLQGATFTGRNAAANENLRIPDQNLHELRVGLRYDIN